jgi:hypothetical protein
MPTDTKCTHVRRTDISTHGYTGSVSVHPYTEENRAAHGNITVEVLDRAERANERDDCYRPEVLAALHAAGRHPVDEDGDDWVPMSAKEADDGEAFAPITVTASGTSSGPASGTASGTALGVEHEAHRKRQ